MTNFRSRYPAAFSLLAGLLPIAGTKLLLAGLAQFGLDPLTLKLISEFFFCAIVAALLTALGVWREAGFLSSITGKTLLIYAPWLLLPLIVVAHGISPAAADTILGIAVFTLMIGFAEEGLFRGVVLRALLPGGIPRAVLTSSIIFGSVHFFNLLRGDDFANVLVQVIYAAFIGIGFAGSLLSTRAIWPAIVLHALIDFATHASHGFNLSIPPQEATLGSVIGSLLVTGPYAIYGWWLMRRSMSNPEAQARLLADE
jgi:membrane protease YdiL (CAAX protease family)